MDTYLLAVGYWNLAGSIMMMGMISPYIGNKMLVEWSRIFSAQFQLGFYGKLWLFWAAGLNIFFGVTHITAATWDEAIQMFFIKADIVIYIIFILLGIWGIIAKKCGIGIYVAFGVFLIWIGWGMILI